MAEKNAMRQSLKLLTMLTLLVTTAAIAQAQQTKLEIGSGGVRPNHSKALPPGGQVDHLVRAQDAGLNIGFAHDPGQGNYDGVVGSPKDVWNFIDIGTTAVDYLRHPNASGSSARIRVSRHDGEWGIPAHRGIFHAYIYHNCQCVDLEVQMLDLRPLRYRAYVFAHGDAPEQNANIEIIVGDRSLGCKATANDGTRSYESNDFKAGIHYVTFDFDVLAGEDVRIISHRDGSGYSMFNAIQLVPLDPEAQRSTRLRNHNADQLDRAIGVQHALQAAQ